ncbi:MAG: hypothetical protein JWN03_7171 [Nocardia sp.]|uniref:hypothetical protein n=1 Tax=Nocardia sp. TaxID=1821 RepID=UPI00260A2423|nr:hypothetical protein [Nocardia sp.]MCU1646896.1 hypothetical protein [Nocardia sp.]
MPSIARKAAGLTAAAVLAAVPLAATAQADDPGPLFFRAGGFNCSIGTDGTVGCDLSSPAWMSIQVAGANIPMPFTVTQVVIDVPWAPAHPGFAPGIYTLPGGNPNIDDVATGGDMWGPSVTYAGATCAVGFHGSFVCNSKGHTFGSYGSTISAS